MTSEALPPAYVYRAISLSLITCHMFAESQGPSRSAAVPATPAPGGPGHGAQTSGATSATAGPGSRVERGSSRGAGMSVGETAARAVSAALAGATGDFKKDQISDIAAARLAESLLPEVAVVLGHGTSEGTGWPDRPLSSCHTSLKNAKAAGAGGVPAIALAGYADAHAAVEANSELPSSAAQQTIVKDMAARCTVMQRTRTACVCHGGCVADTVGTRAGGPVRARARACT